MNDRGYIVYGLANNTLKVPYFFAPQSSELLSGVTGTSAAKISERILYASAATDSICEYGINDIRATYTLAQMQTNYILFWQELAERSQRVWQTTMLPNTTSTDNLTTTTNQLLAGQQVFGATNASPIVINAISPLVDGSVVKVVGLLGNTAANGTWYVKASTFDAQHFALYQDAGLTNPVVGNGAYISGGTVTGSSIEAVRVGANTWLRAGVPVLISGSTITATTSGTAGAVLAAQAGHPLFGVIDANAASGLEVNTAGTPTLNGGYWLPNATANYWTNDGLHPNTPSVLLLAAGIPNALFTTP